MAAAVAQSVSRVLSEGGGTGEHAAVTRNSASAWCTSIHLALAAAYDRHLDRNRSVRRTRIDADTMTRRGGSTRLTWARRRGGPVAVLPDLEGQRTQPQCTNKQDSEWRPEESEMETRLPGTRNWQRAGGIGGLHRNTTLPLRTCDGSLIFGANPPPSRAQFLDAECRRTAGRSPSLLSARASSCSQFSQRIDSSCHSCLPLFRKGVPPTFSLAILCKLYPPTGPYSSRA